MPEHFARVSAQAKRAEDKADKALAKWRWPMRAAAALATMSLGAVTWVLVATREAGYEARRTEEQRATVERLSVEMRGIRETLIRFGERLNAWRPVRTEPVIGPHNKDD
jgi:hypothetical protein